MSNTLKLVLTDLWFEEIKSGRKTHEYRKATDFWSSRLKWFVEPTEDLSDIQAVKGNFVQFQKAYRKNPERMTFEIKDVKLINGNDTDLHYNGLVFEIKLGRRVK